MILPENDSMKDYKNDPVTSIISRRIIPEKQDEFEKFVDKILANFEGYMGSNKTESYWN